MWLLQVTLVAMVNNIISVKLVWEWNSCSMFPLNVLCVCVCSHCMELVQPYPWLNLFFFNLFLWKELTFHPSPFLTSVSLYLSHTLLDSFVSSCCSVAHEHFDCCEWVWSQVRWQSFRKLLLSDDGVFLLLLRFCYCPWRLSYIC